MTPRVTETGDKLIVYVEVMSSAMLGKFVLLNKMVIDRELKLMFANVGREVQEVFRICRLDRVFYFGENDEDGPG